MSGIWGNNIKISIFGESHGKGIGVIIDGLKGGVTLDLEEMKREMQRRAPGNSRLASSRKERDEFDIFSGYFNDKTTGTPLCGVIYNTNQRSKDYEKTKDIIRPGHADYTGYVKYFGANDYRGGGHFSGRITAAIVFAGAIAKQILEKRNIFIGSHIKRVGPIEEDSFDPINIERNFLKKLTYKRFPLIDEEKESPMQELILKVKNELDSIGGIIETAVINVPVGIGSPFFDSIESKLSHILFSIPAVKGVEFGEGFRMANLKGSQANDEYFMKEDQIETYTNHNGGILGGISNGNPIIFRTAFKPTPSIGKTQETVHLRKRENTTLQIQGRHDPCILPRAVPVVEAAAAIGLLDLILERNGIEWMN